ncbi:hypothetical protein BC943DRAFT_381408 [Umbelopsis sp. AD052]|nr:hypothetical protein BC943DRAFT_381408 [Umbelopsis sp. AD052]
MSTPNSTYSGISINATNAESKAFFNILTEVLDSISIAVGFIVIISVVLIRLYRPALGRTITVRLSGWIALADILVCSIQIIYIHGNELFTNVSPLALGFVLTSLQTSSLFFVYLTVCIAINLHLTILTSKYRNVADKIDPWMVPVSFIWANVTTIPFHIWFQAEWNPQIGGFVKTPAWAAPYYMWASQYVWQLLGELYCACVIVMVLVKLYNMRKYQEKQSSAQNRNQIESADQHGRSSKRITFVMLRIVWYPVIPIITQTWLIVMNSIPPPHNITWININNIMSALQGVLNGIVFCLNPATYALWQEWRNKSEVPFSPRASKNARHSFDDGATWVKLQEPAMSTVSENYEMYKPNKPGIPSDW